MLKKNVEVFHQGFLIKSPPSPLSGGLIFKARWRRRFFTLKQGELPAQFFLEYFTDESCRKRKGTIDLDQVEQIDAGLQLEKQKQSVQFQHIFDIVTPHRTYYLAAETEKEMKDWVMVICQVCNLQEAEEKNEEPASSAQYYNLISHPDFEAKVVVQPTTKAATTKTTPNNNNEPSTSSSHVSSRFDSLSIVNEYENDNVAASHMSFQSNLADNSSMFGGPSQNYSNLSSLSIPPEPTRRPSLPTNSINKSTGAIKKIPKRLDLMKDDKINNNNNNSTEENTFRHSGPYIPLSDCFSGSPVFYKTDGDPKTPLNSLDPKFKETPKSHQTNIGLNLTDDQKDIVPSSPKRNNVPASIADQDKVVKLRSPNSTPTDEEGFSTDEEDAEGWRRPKLPANTDQKTLTTSEDNVAIIPSQDLKCYMKVSALNPGNPLPLPPKRMSFIESKKHEISDSEENMSPIGPADRSCVVEDQYDIPRSYNFPPSKLHHRSASLITSTPNLVSSPDHLNKSDMNFYSNFAPSEQMVFRFDETPPVVNRTLKPGKESSSTNSLNAPKVDRNLKPLKLSKSRHNTINSKDIENSQPSDFDDSTLFNESMASQTLRASGSFKNNEKLQYLDLDHDNSPPKSSFTGSVASFASSSQHMMDISINGSIKSENPAINYTTVDFLKTDAFLKTRVNRLKEDHPETIRTSKSKQKK